ncbi:MAG TPA: ATP-dependent DNA ligase [Gemmatimonadaceae bacterium]|nr:ATP-dependent DNA ligase [Gemmatimonadaceae bacterium]
MPLPISTGFAPMEAQSDDTLPVGSEWRYEPKWDGFRCLAFRDGAKIDLRSKSGQPLARYFPEMVDALLSLGAKRFVLDGELVIPSGKSLSFDDLLLRLHPAESRVQRLAKETPALFLVFDILVDERNGSHVGRPLDERRKSLEAFARRYFASAAQVRLSPMTRSVRTARGWLTGRSGLDGVIAKLGSAAYASGERTAMKKIKRLRTADCVVGGFRYAAKAKIVGSLLLGLYDEDDLLHHVGFSSSFTAAQRVELLQVVEPLVGPPGFTGRAPGGPSRWSTERSGEWQPLSPKLIVEVQYDHFSGGRFRHGTKFLRWRPDKAPEQCRMAQVEKEARSSLKLLESL